MIVPPPKERDPKLQNELFRLPERPKVHGVLTGYWTGRPVLLQCTYLIREIDSAPDKWLPSLFSDARDHGIQAVPAFTLSEIAKLGAAVRTSVSRIGELALGIIISSAELGDPELPEKINSGLDALRVGSSECIVFADFADSDLSEPEIVAPIIRASYECLERIGPWKHIAFQATSYPEHNPASHGLTARVDRNEWLAWTAAVDYQRNPRDDLLFGDFVADCAKMSFGESQARAIRHMRYTTNECWFVVRASETGRDADRMRQVCKRIVESAWYDGRSYSMADDRIFRIAHGLAGPGTATDWRAVNTGHHISRVVRDLGAVRNIHFARLDETKLESPQEGIPHLLGASGHGPKGDA
ncbi:MAG: hypothetical protein H0T60_17760 [Acidobacteria bacterium]|nr:hypothetical protein [Acidobacteriota bacterium]